MFEPDFILFMNDFVDVIFHYHYFTTHNPVEEDNLENWFDRVYGSDGAEMVQSQMASAPTVEHIPTEGR